jgi:hypothetical protein
MVGRRKSIRKSQVNKLKYQNNTKLASRNSKMKIELQPNKKIYFASDQHFGAPTPELSKPREGNF